MSKKLPLCGTTKFIKMLKFDGFIFKKKSNATSHTTYIKPKTTNNTHRVVTVQLDQKEYKKGLLDSMRKQAGWSRNEYTRIHNEV